MRATETRVVTLRRTMQQAIHCLEEATSAWIEGEDVNCAIDDVEQAHLLCEQILLSLNAAKKERINSAVSRSVWTYDGE